jgi:hypothetical protein
MSQKPCLKQLPQMIPLALTWNTLSTMKQQVGKKGLKPDLAENKKTSLTDPIKKSKRIYA